MIDMTKYTAAATYAEKHNMTAAQVINEIKDGDLVGQIYRGAWFVKVGIASGPDAKKSTAVENYVEVNSRSPGMAFALALLFGPVGAIYGSVIGGLILVLMAFFAVMGTGIIGMVIIWVASMVVGYAGAVHHNDKMRASAELIAGHK